MKIATNVQGLPPRLSRRRLGQIVAHIEFSECSHPEASGERCNPAETAPTHAGNRCCMPFIFLLQLLFP
jgi:hypothetical protein